MTRIVLAAFAALTLGGCRQQGEQVIDPFWGRQTVQPPGTGAVGTAVVYPGYPPATTAPQPAGPGSTAPTWALPSSTPPNLLPTPMTSPGGGLRPQRQPFRPFLRQRAAHSHSAAGQGDHAAFFTAVGIWGAQSRVGRLAPGNAVAKRTVADPSRCRVAVPRRRIAAGSIWVIARPI